MDDREILIRQTVLIEEISKKISVIENNVNAMKDGHIRETESRMAVQEEKMTRLEKIVYGAVALIIIQGFGLLMQFLKK